MGLSDDWKSGPGKGQDSSNYGSTLVQTVSSSPQHQEVLDRPAFSEKVIANSDEQIDHKYKILHPVTSDFQDLCAVDASGGDEPPSTNSTNTTPETDRGDSEKHEPNRDNEKDYIMSKEDSSGVQEDADTALVVAITTTAAANKKESRKEKRSKEKKERRERRTSNRNRGASKSEDERWHCTYCGTSLPNQREFHVSCAQSQSLCRQLSSHEPSLQAHCRTDQHQQAIMSDEGT